MIKKNLRTNKYSEKMKKSPQNLEKSEKTKNDTIVNPPIIYTDAELFWENLPQ